MGLGFHLVAMPDSGLQQQLGDLLARHLASADMLGRMQILRHAQAKLGRRLPLAQSGRHIFFDESQQGAAGFGMDVGAGETAAQIGSLTAVTKQVFDGLTAHYRRDAFTLAGVSDVRLVEKIRDALADIAQKGGTVQDFQKAVQSLTDQTGVERLSAFSLDTAFNTAMQKAYSAGRLAQMQEHHMTAAMPFWQYWTVGDDRVRPEHAVLDGFMARAIDPVWAKIYPPSGFNCRCSVVPIAEDEALKIDKDASEGGMERLPLLARALVPQNGFHTLIRP